MRSNSQSNELKLAIDLIRNQRQDSDPDLTIQQRRSGMEEGIPPFTIPDGIAKLTFLHYSKTPNNHSNHRCIFPRRKGTQSEISISLRRDQMTTQVEQVVDSGVSIQEPLSLFHGFESPHTSLPHPCRLM